MPYMLLLNNQATILIHGLVDGARPNLLSPVSNPNLPEHLWYETQPTSR
jgi:hypothetical protein